MSEDKRSDDAMRVDTDLIRQLANLLAEKDLSEIEVEDSGRRIMVKRKLTAAAAPAAIAAAPSANPAPAAAGSAAPVDAAQEAGNHPGAVKAPMVGTVYLSSEPGGTPFVTPGSKVEAGETLVIVEAMKVMNAIHAPKAGTVKQVLVQDAQPVEFDQPLVIIE